MSAGWNVNDFTTPFPPNISFLFTKKIIALDQNVANYQNTLTVFTLMWRVLFKRCMNASDAYDRCGHDTRQFHSSFTACKRTANLPGLACQNEACLQPHHSNHLTKWK